MTEVCGKNLLDPSTKTEFNANTWRWHYSDGYVLKKNVAYNFSWGNKGNNSFNIYLYIADFDTGANYNTGNNSISYTPTEDIKVKFQAYYSGGIPTDAVFQLELGSTATDYEPYQGNTYTTTLGRTVYGGTLDVVSGELVVDRVAVDMGTLDWIVNSSANHIFQATPSPVMKTEPSYADRRTGFVCSCYPADTQIIISESMNNETMLRNAGFIFVRDNNYSSATDFKSAVSGQTLVYELATPQTYQLDPQTIDLLLGQNNLWTDCGSVEVTYKADVGLYIDKKLSSNGTRSLSMGLTKSATVEAEAEETKTETEETETETETEQR